MMELLLLIGLILLIGTVGGLSGLAWHRQRKRFAALAQYNRGVAHLERGEYLNAVSAFQAALQQQPTLSNARYGMGLAYLKEKRFFDAIKLLETALREKPDDAMAACNLGWAYLSIGKLEDAKHVLEQGIRANPNLKELYFNLSRVFKDKGDREQATLYCRRALEIDQQYAQAKMELDELAEIRYDAALNLDAIRQALTNFDTDDTELMIRL